MAALPGYSTRILCRPGHSCGATQVEAVSKKYFQHFEGVVIIVSDLCSAERMRGRNTSGSTPRFWVTSFHFYISFHFSLQAKLRLFFFFVWKLSKQKTRSSHSLVYWATDLVQDRKWSCGRTMALISSSLR